MKYELARVAIRTVLPSLLGAFGALAATLAPAYYKAVCFGTPLFHGGY